MTARKSILLSAAILAVASSIAVAQPPGPETFGKKPTTALELWDAADYLVRTGQAKQAVPYLNLFIQGKPDDATLIEVRDRYGAKSILRLQDDPATRALAEPLANMLAAATRRNAARPDRIARFIGDLTKSREEQDYALERLREAGPFAVPALVQELGKAGQTAENRALLVDALGRLDRSAVPALLAVLDAAPSNPSLAADVAEILGRIGDPRALPALTMTAALPNTPLPARAAAARAVARITGRPFELQTKSPVRLLVDEARRYHTHAIQFPGDAVVLWIWDEAAKVPVATTLARTDAEAALGLKLARAALAIDPTDRQAQVVTLSIALEKAVEKAGYGNYPATDPSNTFSGAVAAGPAVLGDVLRQAIADGKSDLAAVATTALGKVTDASALAVDGQANPLVAALSAPGRRTRLAAAKALVALDPRRPFAGSSGVVSTLAQFVTTQGPPRAVIIDGNPSRGGQLAGFLKALGYEPDLRPTGPEGFKAAAESADTELVMVDVHMIGGDWRLHDVLSNLKADARTASLPVYLVAPRTLEADMLSLTRRFPGVKWIVTSMNPQILDQQLAIAGRPAPLSAEERAGYAREAIGLLAQIAARPNSPFEPDLVRIEPELTVALHTPGPDLVATTVMGDVPAPNAQRGLADLLLDPARAAPLRLSAATQLAKSVQRFGPLVAADQEAKIVAVYDREADPALRTALGAVIGALRPKSAPAGVRLRGVASTPAPALVPAPALNSSEPAAPTSPEAAPAPEPSPAPPPAPGTPM